MARYGKRKATAKADAKRISVKEKHAQALALRTRGMTYGAIAHELGYTNKATVAKLIEREIRKIPRLDAETQREVECAKLDAAEQRLSRALDTAVTARAVSALVRAQVLVYGRRAKLLGLDAPEAAAAAVPRDQVKIEIICAPDVEEPK